MIITLDQDGSIGLSRSERIVRGQNGSKIIEVNWLKGCSPVEQNLVLLDNFVVRVNITRPDGEQSGWQAMHKTDGAIKYYYKLQAWDTAVAGTAKVSIQCYDCSDTTEPEGIIIYASQEGQMIIDNGAIAQPLGISNENYDNMLTLLSPITNQAFRKYDVNHIPETIDYQASGKKTAPALYYNAQMPIKVYDGKTNQYIDSTVKGCLFVGKQDVGENVEQSELFIVGNKVYMRKLIIVDYESNEPKVINSSEGDAIFYDLSTTIKDYVKYQIETYGYDKASIDAMFDEFVEDYKTYLKKWYTYQKKEFDERFEAQEEDFDNQFKELNKRMQSVERDSLIRLPGVAISDQDLIDTILNMVDTGKYNNLYIVNTAQFGDEILVITKTEDETLIARYTATGASYFWDAEINEWTMSAGGGGGGSGGGGSNMRFVNMTPLQFVTAVGAETLLTYNFKSSVAGKGTLKVYVNDALKSTTTVSQGTNSFNATSFIASGSTTIKLTMTDSAGSSKSLEYLIEGVELKLTSNFDDEQAYNGDIEFRYLVSGETEKTIHFVLDGTELESAVTESVRQQTYTIPSLTHGVHKLEVYAVALINEIELTSNTLTYNVIAYEEGNNTILISSKFNQTESTEGETVSIDYIVYDPANPTSSIELKINDVTSQTLTVGRTCQYWNLRSLAVGNNTVSIVCGEVELSFDITVSEADINVEPVSEGLELFLDAYGRSNSESNRDVWKYGDIEAVFTNLNWSTNGWLNNALRLNGNAQLTIPFKIFESDFRNYGKTIEFEFATRDVATIDTIAIMSFSNNKGIKLKMNEALIQSEQSSILTKYKDEERIRISFVIDDKNNLRLIRTFINGVLSGLAQYPINDDFSQSTPVGITINPDGGSVDIYKIRIYNTALTDRDMLNNYIADIDSVGDKVLAYTENDIFNANGEVLFSKVKTKIPTLVITGTLPTVKGDKKSAVVTYEDPFNTSRNFEQNATVDVQGTSSQYYPRKNWKIKLTEAIDFFKNGISENTYTIKVNYMESGNRNNTGIANFLENEKGKIYSEKLPPQETNEAIRSCINGQPVVVFHKTNASSTPKFYAIGQFNNDKGNSDTLGLTEEYPNAESWEFCDNDELLCLFRTNDFTRNANAFEARYPDKNTNYTQIDALVSWVYSTLDDLDKFKNEFEEHFNLHYTLMYYILTEAFGMVDSRAKNMFLDTWDGVIWYPVFYDMDTSFGLNNEGVNDFNYNIEYNDQIGSQNVYNGSSSLLWNNFKTAFADEIKEMYQTLRSSGKLSYNSVMEALDSVTSKFSKALYNVDAENKYIGPLEENNDANYLYCAQGDRKEHLKWWLANRFKYLDSKYYASEYADDYISMRIYSPGSNASTNVVPFNGTFTLKSFIAQYLSVRYGANGDIYTKRAEAEVSTSISATSGTDLNDKETYVYGASKIKDLGDLSNKYVGTLDVSKATKLTELKVGNSKTNYSNTNLTDLKIGNNDLLQLLDIRNCPNLTQPIDVSGCKNIKTIYATGTSITAVSLAEGGNLETLTLPATITNLTLKNQPSITTITMAGVTNVSTLVIESCSSAVNTLAQNIVTNSTALSRVRLTNIDWSLTDKAVFDKLMTCGGVDESNNNTDKAIVTGKVYIESIGQGDIDAIKAYFPNLTINYGTLIQQFTVTFQNWDGTVLENQLVNKGASAVDPVTRANNPIATPTRERDAQYTYTYKGWGSALTGVYADRVIVAQYTQTINSYTVNFYNNSSGTPELLFTQTVDYGSPAKYGGTKPVYGGSSSGTFLFSGWEPSITNITEDLDTCAIFSELALPTEQKAFADCTWAQIKAVLTNGSVNDSNQWCIGDVVWFEVGDEKPITLSNGETLTMQIIDFNHDVDSSNNTLPCTLATKELMATSRSMNSSNTNAGGWCNSKMYTYLQGEVYEMLPADLQAVITPAVKKSTEGSQSTNILSSTDNLFLLSYSEVGFGTSSPYGDEGTPYPYFASTTQRKKYKVGATSADWWWLRSPYPSDTYYFHYVNSNGYSSYGSASYTSGVCFALCI